VLTKIKKTLRVKNMTILIYIDYDLYLHTLHTLRNLLMDPNEKK
jgi:hypothetical protein